MRANLVRTVLFLVAVLLTGSACLADTVILKDDRRIKGLILDEFKDRIVLSTAGGEKTIFKSDIRYAMYDDEERALLQTGRAQFKKRQYIEAYYTYEEALELNPDLEEARQKLDYLRSYVETKTRYDVLDAVRTKNELYGGAEGKTLVKEVREELGFVLGADGKYVFIDKIIKNMSGKDSSPYKEGDRIISVWGEMAAYMGVDEVAEMLLRPGEIRFVVERATMPKLFVPNPITAILMLSNYRSIAGAELKLARKGVTIDRVFPEGPFSRAGIMAKDLLYRIGGRNTRYMPLRDVINVIMSNRGRELEVVVHRDITIWKKDR